MTGDPKRQRVDISLLAAMLPEFLDMIQYQSAGNDEQAALSLLAALPPGGDTTLIERYGKGIEWAIGVYGTDAVRTVAAQARDLPEGAERTARIDELATMLSTDDMDARVNEALDRIQKGETPTQLDLRILVTAKSLYRQ